MTELFGYSFGVWILVMVFWVRRIAIQVFGYGAFPPDIVAALILFFSFPVSLTTFLSPSLLSFTNRRCFSPFSGTSDLDTLFISMGISSPLA